MSCIVLFAVAIAGMVLFRRRLPGVPVNWQFVASLFIGFFVAAALLKQFRPFLFTDDMPPWAAPLLIAFGAFIFGGAIGELLTMFSPKDKDR